MEQVNRNSSFIILLTVLVACLSCQNKPSKAQLSESETHTTNSQWNDSLFYTQTTRDFEAKQVTKALNSSAELLTEVTDELKAEIASSLDMNETLVSPYYYRKFKSVGSVTPMVVLVSHLSFESLIFITVSQDQKVVSKIDLVNDKCVLADQDEEKEVINCLVRKSNFDEELNELKVIEVLSEELDYGNTKKVTKDSVIYRYNIDANKGQLILDKKDSIRISR